MKCKNCGGYLSEEYSHHKKVKKKYCSQECGWEMRKKRAMKKICQKCFCIIEDGVGHADWCDDTVEKLKELFGFNEKEK